MQLSILYFVKRNVRNLIIFLIIMAAITIGYGVLARTTILNTIFAPIELDRQDAFVSRNLETLHGIYYSPESENSGEAQETDLNGIDNAKIPDDQYYVFSHLDNEEGSGFRDGYRQKGVYRLQLKPNSAYELGLAYEAAFAGNDPSEPLLTHKYILLDTGEAFVLAKVTPDFEIEPNHTYTGVFLPISGALRTDVKKALGQGDNIEPLFEYQLDTITGFSLIEISDLVLLCILAAIIIFIGVKIFIYKRNYESHPTYRQLHHLYGEPGEIVLSINSELADVSGVLNKKNVYMTDSWIISKGLFKTKIIRNLKEKQLSGTL